MNALKLSSIVAIMCLVGSGASAEEKKVDYAKAIVGKWEITQADPNTVEVGTKVEFTKDGKFLLSGKINGEDRKMEGTYTVEANTFTFKIKDGDVERSQKITITKFDGKEMSTKDERDKVVVCKREK